MRIAIASVVSGLVAMAFGALWYGLFSAQWQAAAGVTQDDMNNMGALMYAIPVIAWIVGAAAMNMLFLQLKDTSLAALIRATVMMWLSGAVIATVLSTVFGGRGADLYWIDGLHLLIAMIIMAVISKFIAHRG